MLQGSDALTWMKDEQSLKDVFNQLTINTNPLLNTPITEDDVVLDFKLTSVSSIEKQTRKILKHTNAIYNSIADLQFNNQPVSFYNTFGAIIYNDIVLANLRAVTTELKDFSTDEKVRKACSDADKTLKNHDIECSMRHDVYTVLNFYVENALPLEQDRLSSEQHRFITKTMQAYQRNGMHLDENAREQVKLIKQQISELEAEFRRNLNEDNTCFTFTRQELAGMPENWFAGKKALESNRYEVSLKYPDILPAMEYVKDRAVREMLYTAFDSRCKETNTAIIEKTLKLRQQLAKVLGYNCFADIQIEPKMAKTSATVYQFLKELNEKFSSLFTKEHAELTNLAIAHTGDANFKLAPWDYKYYIRLNKEKQCNIDIEQIRAYFPLAKVKQGLFSIYEQLLGLKFVQVNTDNKWHNDVEVYEVFNYDHQHRSLGKSIGHFYLDLHPREGKYSHAAVYPVINGCDLSEITNNEGDYRRPICFMACNFPKDECLQFKQVITFFHEFGHVMHGICSSTQLPHHFGTNVEQDFVEAPSQMLENWCYSKKALQLMSAHTETGKPIPEYLVDKLLIMERLNNGFHYKRQIALGLFDLAIHSIPADNMEEIKVKQIWDDIFYQVMGFNDAKDTNMPATFGHLMGEYQAGYYGYLYSKVFAADMFNTVFSENELDPKVGEFYRNEILEPGGSRDAEESLRRFLGREPRMDAFLHFCGLQKPENSNENKQSPTIS